MKAAANRNNIDRPPSGSELPRGSSGGRDRLWARLRVGVATGGCRLDRHGDRHQHPSGEVIFVHERAEGSSAATRVARTIDAHPAKGVIAEHDFCVIPISATAVPMMTMPVDRMKAAVLDRERVSQQ